MTETGRSAEDLGRALGHGFARRRLAETALTHPSAAAGPGASYERLEFLGDRVLALVVADMLMARFPDESEGDLARRHGALVDRDSLVSVARALDLGGYLRMSAGEAAAGTRDSDSVLADSLEAVLGALYLDGGLEAASAVIRRLWTPLVAAVRAPPQDAKTELQEWVQARGGGLPEYVVVVESGPPHRPVFTVEVRVEALAPARAEGGSKRVAEQRAARALLQRIKAPAADDGD